MTNQGYEIFATYRKGNCGVVLGERKTGLAGVEYVTWMWNPANDYFYWGHYFEDRKLAAVDFMERLRKLEEWTK